jgi:DNA-binding MarR family transcriptional regulator
MPTRRRRATNDEALVARQLAAGLGQLALVLRNSAWREAAPRGLTPTQMQILAVLTTHTDAVRLSTVAEGLAVSLPTASDAVASLVAKGLVKKVRAADDARAVALTLTSAGRHAAAEQTRTPPFVQAAVESLSLSEQGELMRAVSKMIRTLQERGDIAPARSCVSCQFFRPWAHPGNAAQPHHCGFVDAAFGDRALRIDCEDYQHAPAAQRERAWQTFAVEPGGHR